MMVRVKRSGEQPRIVEVAGVPDLYCDLAIVEPFDGTVRIKLARLVSRNGDTYELVGIVTMQTEAWLHSRALNDEMLPPMN